jgi:hypothetical protein
MGLSHSNAWPGKSSIRIERVAYRIKSTSKTVDISKLMWFMCADNNLVVASVSRKT